MTEKANPGFIPRPIGEFDDFQRKFYKIVTDNFTAWGLDTNTDATGEWKTLTLTPGPPISKKVRFENAWAIVNTKKFYDSDELELKEARHSYESGDRNNIADTSIRIFINRYIRFNPKVTNKQKMDMGLTIPDITITPTTDTNEKITGTEIIGTIKKSGHLSQTSQVTIVGRKSKAKEKGVDRIGVYMAITEAKAGQPELSAFQYVGDVSRGLYTHTFEPLEEGMRAWYYAVKVLKGRTKIIGKPSKVWSGVIA